MGRWVFDAGEFWQQNPQRATSEEEDKQEIVADKERYFFSLDALRGIAALTVAIWHLYTNKWSGYLAVDFFLVLSGFVLSHVYLYGNRSFSSAEFIGHRLARLYPLHIYTLIVFAFVYLLIFKSLPVTKDGTLFTLIQHITMTHNIGFNPGGLTWNFPSWSISVEFWINILFLLFITRSTKSSHLLLISIFSLVLIYNNSHTLNIAWTNYYNVINSGMVRGIASFLLGILAYRMYLWFTTTNNLITTNIKGIIPAADVAEVVAFLLCTFIILKSPNKKSLDFCSPFLFMFTVTIFGIEAGLLSRILKKLRYLGTISYSIYLNHITVFGITWALFGKPKVFSIPAVVLYILGVLIYSHLTYKYVEKPARIKGRKLVDKFAKKFSTEG